MIVHYLDTFIDESFIMDHYSKSKIDVEGMFCFCSKDYCPNHPIVTNIQIGKGLKKTFKQSTEQLPSSSARNGQIITQNFQSDFDSPFINMDISRETIEKKSLSIISLLDQIVPQKHAKLIGIQINFLYGHTENMKSILRKK